MTSHLRPDEATTLGFTRNDGPASRIKAWLLAGAVTLPFLATAAPTLADDRSEACSNASLKGRYAVATHGEALGVKDSSGVIQLFNAAIRVDGVSVETFDGRGNATYAHSLFANGSQLCREAEHTCGDVFSAAADASYQVNADCTGFEDITYSTTASNTLRIHRSFVLSSRGKTVHMLWTGVHFPALSPATGVTCSLAAGGCDLAAQLHSDGDRLVGIGDPGIRPER